MIVKGAEDLGITCDCSSMSQLSSLVLPDLTPTPPLPLYPDTLPHRADSTPSP